MSPYGSCELSFNNVGVGLVLAVLGGSLISRMKMEHHVEAFVFNSPVMQSEDGHLSRRERFEFARDQVAEIFGKVWLYVLIGVGIGAAIHNWVPAAFISALLGQDKWWSVLVATAVGIPMYADIFGTLPIAEALVGKGVGIGTALALMMAVTALSLPSMIMLKRVVKMPLLLLFVGTVAAGIIVIGYFFNSFGAMFL